MERYSDEAIRIIDELHTERLDYQSEYIPLIDAAQRLDAYESTGMEPENIGALQEELNQYKKLGDLDRLREIVQADRERRCVVLPCKLHDKVFFIENGCVKETEVDSFHNWTSGRWKISTHTDRMYEHWKGYEIDFSGIGKTVFLSREDAEKAVEMEENRNG